MAFEKAVGFKSLKKILKVYRQRRLLTIIFSRLKPFLRSLRYILYYPVSACRMVSIHCPGYVNPNKGKREMEIVERVFCSFWKMKEQQKKVQQCYLPSSLWQHQIEKPYAWLLWGWRNNDINKFHYFLSNFGTWKEYTGIEDSAWIWENTKSFMKRRYLKNDVFYNQLKIWRWFYNSRKAISRLSYPTYGNQSGAYIDNVFVGPGSFFNEIYGSILSGLIVDEQRPVVAELGAGYGKLAYFILRDIGSFTFIDFDLPEILCLAAYYLMMVYPQKRALLYGEEEYSSKTHDNYDLIFMPSYEISKVGLSTVDLFINKNSLGEMDEEAVNNYINYISQSTRKYFFHMNHEIMPNVYDNNKRGLLGYEYPVSLDRFTMVFRYPDLGHMFSNGRMDFSQDIFTYLYARK